MPGRLPVRAAVAAGALLCSAGPPRAVEAASPAGFLQALYARYPLAEGRAPPVLDRPRDWLADPLLRLVLRDGAAAKGEVGALDFDPVCACQDDAGLAGTAVSVQEEDGRAARASARFTLGGRAVQVRYRLVATPNGWRIADIATREVPSLLDLLAKASR